MTDEQCWFFTQAAMMVGGVLVAAPMETMVYFLA